RRGNELALLGIFAAACVVAMLLFALSSRVQRWHRHGGVALGAALVALCVYFSGQSTSPLAVFYVWVATYSSYFFTRRAFVAHMIWAGVAYAAVLEIQQQGGDS